LVVGAEIAKGHNGVVIAARSTLTQMPLSDCQTGRHTNAQSN